MKCFVSILRTAGSFMGLSYERLKKTVIEIEIMVNYAYAV